MKIYVATSWRNDSQPGVVRGLRVIGHEVYDFRNPKDGDTGFHWSQIDPQWQTWDVRTYVESLLHPLAVGGFKKDFDAMKWAEGCVLVMPCGRSAHLEAGWFVGQEKPLWILKSEGEPELMYKMANGIYAGLGPLILDIQAWEQTRAEAQDSAE